jgi:predicted nucleic acid-binding protein
LIFLDASVLLASENAADPEHAASVALLKSAELGTLDLALYEVTNVAAKVWQDEPAAARLRERVWAIANDGTLIRVDRELGADIARLLATHNLSAYDAAYLAGAGRLGVPLASCDHRDLVGPRLAQLPSVLVRE